MMLLFYFDQTWLVICIDLTPEQSASFLFHGQQNRKDARETSETSFYSQSSSRITRSTITLSPVPT
jgi:hypothetical protein